MRIEVHSLRPTIPVGELIVYLFGADRSSLTAEVGPWLFESPRFRAFAETYRDKIRKKTRGLRDDEGRRDFAFELANLVAIGRSEEHTSELQSLAYLVCRLLLEK